jgi:predicted nucleic acid-binding protein
VARVFVDTSAVVAYMVAGDDEHRRAVKAWERALPEGWTFATHSYVLTESIALLQRRHGLSVVSDVRDQLLPTIELVHWVDRDDHETAFGTLAASDRAAVSFVDRVSFHVMRRLRIRLALAFDPHFADEGFELVG